MQLLGLESSVPDQLRESIQASLSDHGDVGYLDATGEVAANNPQLSLDAAGGFHYESPVGDLSAALDLLASRCDVAIVEGMTGEWPTLRVTDGMVEGELLAEPTPVEEVDEEALITKLKATPPWESLESLIAAVKDSPEADQAGAIATFTGRVRVKEDVDDTPTKYLEFDAYGDVADKRMATLRDELRDRPGVYDVRLHHRTGVISQGEDIVFVVVLAGHRQEAFETVEDGINRLKAEVPIFKKEVTVDEEFWVHTRP